MQWGLGVLGWSAKDFWRSTPVELKNAIIGWKLSNGVETGQTNDKGQPVLSAGEVDNLRELMAEHG